MIEKKKLLTIIYTMAVACWLALMVISKLSLWTALTWIIWLTVLAFCTKSDIESRKIKNIYLLYGLSTTLIVILMQWIFRILNSHSISQSTKVLMRELSCACVAMVIWLVGMLILSFITRHGIGYGDVKLFSMLAFILGVYENFYVFVMTFVLAGVTAALLLCRKKTKAKVPLAPFIMTGFYIFTLTHMGLMIYDVI